MSETTEQPGGPAPEVDPASAPQPDAPAPETTETPEPEHEEKPDPEGRRVAALRARLGAAEREQERQRAELEFYRRQAAWQPPDANTPEQVALRQRAEIRAEVEAQIRAENFHERGVTEFPDWRQRCDDLVKMGADSGFAQLLVEMPEGVKVAAALAGDPEAVERISALRSERARAVALGKYAATLDTETATPRSLPQRVQPVTRAPAPVRAVTGRAAPVFNEYNASGDVLVDYYLKKDMERRQGR